MVRARCRALFTETTAGVEQVGHLGGLPAQHLAQDQHGPLPGRQVLQGRDERQPNGVLQHRPLGRILSGGSGPSPGSGSIQADSGSGRTGSVLDGTGADRSIGSARRLRLRSMSRQTLVAIR